MCLSGARWFEGTRVRTKAVCLSRGAQRSASVVGSVGASDRSRTGDPSQLWAPRPPELRGWCAFLWEGRVAPFQPGDSSPETSVWRNWGPWLFSAGRGFKLVQAGLCGGEPAQRAVRASPPGGARVGASPSSK